jgi:signal transduction histidine kinase
MRLRLFLSFALIVLVSVFSVVILARQSAAQEVRTFMLRGGMMGIDTLVTTLEGYYQTHRTWVGVEQVFSAVQKGRGWQHGQSMGQGMAGMGMMGQRLRLTDEQGNLILDSSGASSEGRVSQEELQRAIPLYDGKQIVGYLLPEGGMVFSVGDEVLLVNRLTRAAITAGAIAGSLSLLLALVLAYRLLKPVRALTQAAGHLAQGDLSHRVEVHGDDELATLGRAFNQMADALQSAEESRRAMTADIAHELRNPLAVQRANLEALQDGIYPLTPENLTPILEQNLLLTRLVEDLRTLALADSGHLNLERSPTLLRDCVQRVVEQFSPQADSRGIAIQWSAREDCPPVNVDAGRIEQIIGNLLSNALRYTPQGGKIWLDLTCTGEQIQLTVRDSGPGIPVEALPHVFERFFRADRSRSRAEGGSGLGLAIARRLAEAHGGSLTAANHPQGGALFTLTLPLNS